MICFFDLERITPYLLKNTKQSSSIDVYKSYKHKKIDHDGGRLVLEGALGLDVLQEAAQFLLRESAL